MKYCTLTKSETCDCQYPNEDGSCSYMYDSERIYPPFKWNGEWPPPPKWTTADGTIVYRTYADYCDD